MNRNLVRLEKQIRLTYNVSVYKFVRFWTKTLAVKNYNRMTVVQNRANGGTLSDKQLYLNVDRYLVNTFRPNTDHFYMKINQ